MENNRKNKNLQFGSWVVLLFHAFVYFYYIYYFKYNNIGLDLRRFIHDMADILGGIFLYLSIAFALAFSSRPVKYISVTLGVADILLCEAYWHYNQIVAWP